MGASQIKKFAEMGANIEITEEAKIGARFVKEIIEIVVAKGKNIKVHAKHYGAKEIREMIEKGGDKITIVI